MYEGSGKTGANDRQQADLLFGLIHVGPGLLQQFIDGARRELGRLRSMCRDAAASGRCRDMIEPAFRLVHGIKGNAALFDLTVYRDYSEDLEDELQCLRGSAEQACEARLEGFADKVAAMENGLVETERLLAELIEMQRASTSVQTPTQSLLTNLRLMIDELCIGPDKQVCLSCIEFDLESLPGAVYSNIVEIVTQLVRNAVAHGIEPADRRRRLSKPGQGTIYLQTGLHADRWFLRVQDDGAGPDFQRLGKIAAARSDDAGKRSAKTDRNQLVRMMFSPGVSTSQAPDDAAGRGVGMDMVLKHTQSLDGRLELRYAVGGGCRFDVLLPQSVMEQDT